MKTAIEWLESEILKLENKHNIPIEVYKLCEKAIAMEEKQIRKAYSTGYNESSWGRFSDSEKYYNETFKP